MQTIKLKPWNASGKVITVTIDANGRVSGHFRNPSTIELYENGNGPMASITSRHGGGYKMSIRHYQVVA